MDHYALVGILAVALLISIACCIRTIRPMQQQITALLARLEGEAIARQTLAGDSARHEIALTALSQRFGELPAGMFAQPVTQEPHSHVYGGQADEEDATSRTYYCRVPYCSRRSTVMR